MRKLIRLLWYSISGWDQLPIILNHEKTYSTTTILNGTSSLFLSTMRKLIRLLRYSISGWDQLPIFLVHKTTYSTTAVLELRMGHAPYFPRGISSSMRRQLIDYLGTRPSDRTRSLSPKKTYSSRLQNDELSDYSGSRPTDGTCFLSPKEDSFFSSAKQ
jgi:hypothetical protein